MNRKKLLIIAAVIFQIGVVAAMVVSREWLLATGKSYVFQTAPIDPRDIFRGDYVRLNYLFNRIASDQLEETIRKTGLRKGQKVYLQLKTDTGGVSDGEKLYASPPQGAYLSGYVTSHWPYRNFHKQNEEQRRKASVDTWPVRVKYGIEQYYVQQGSGHEMEEIRGSRNKFQVPLLIHTAVSESGEAAIRSYEWGNVAIKTEIIRSPDRDAAEDKASTVIEITLKNRGSKTLKLPLQVNNCSFELIPDRNAPQDALKFAAPRNCTDEATQTVVLQPGESHSLDFDFNRSHWWVVYQDKPTPLGRLPWRYRYRIRYTGQQVEGLNAAILSSAFHGRGNID